MAFYLVNFFSSNEEVAAVSPRRSIMKVLFVLLIFYLKECSPMELPYQRHDPIPLDPRRDYGQALFLTPYIEAGEIEEGQAAAKVPPMMKNVSSYSGFFTVSKEYNSSLFFWYFPSETDPSAPVLLWLQGGPGSSSLFGLFSENGPFYVTPGLGLGPRKYYWSQLFNVVYIDNPVGTGFSFTDSDSGFARNQTDVGGNLYSAVQQFLDLFPDLRGNDFYVTGESYAGKYVPALAYAIHANNPKNPKKINLKGVAIGNGFCDPQNMIDYGSYLYQIGLIDSHQKDIFEEEQNKIIQLIQEQSFTDAYFSFNELILGDSTKGHTSIFQNFTGFTFHFNYLHNKDDSPYGDLDAYLAKDVVRRSIHTGNLVYNSGKKVEEFLRNDFMQSVRPWVEVLVENYKVLVYNGQLDIIVPHPLTVNFLRRLEWSGSGRYKTAERKIWRVGGDIAGYVRQVDGLTEVLVRNAGHMVPGDQSLWALDMISRFVYNKSF